MLTADFSQQEHHRLVAAAYDLFMARGIGPVAPSDVALSARLPAATLERYFPAGKADLVAAAADRYLAAFRQRLADNQQQMYASPFGKPVVSREKRIFTT